jgi:hypothetical protein
MTHISSERDNDRFTRTVVGRTQIVEFTVVDGAVGAHHLFERLDFHVDQRRLDRFGDFVGMVDRLDLPIALAALKSKIKIENFVLFVLLSHTHNRGASRTIQLESALIGS